MEALGTSHSPQNQASMPPRSFFIRLYPSQRAHGDGELAVERSLTGAARRARSILPISRPLSMLPAAPNSIHR